MDHISPYWYIRGSDPTPPYQALVIRQSATLSAKASRATGPQGVIRLLGPRVGHIDRSVERRGGIESAPVISAPESSWTESTHLNQHSPPSVGLSVCYPKAE